eukprot:g1531.t1
MLPLIEARDYVHRLKLTRWEEWQEWSKSGQRPCNVPSHPDQVYKGKGWVSWPDWMGYKPKNQKAKSQQMLAYEDARAIVIKLKLTSREEWKEWSKSGQRPCNVPAGPDQVYKGKGWVSWPDWMGYKPKNQKAKSEQMLAYEDARAIVIKLKLTSVEEWREWSKSGQRPCNVPAGPDQVYKGKGWPLCPITTEIGHLSCVHSFHVDCLNSHARASAKPSTTSRRGVLLNCPLCRKRTRWLPPPPPEP